MERKYFPGMKVGKWHLIEVKSYVFYGPNRKRKNVWECQCECGAVELVNVNVFSHGSSGCIKCRTTKNLEHLLKVGFKHGLSRDIGYRRWALMIGRCYNISYSIYKDYGGRGIYVCDRWKLGENGRTGFECFIDDLGEAASQPGKHLHRKDNDGPYSKDNCVLLDVHEHMLLSGRRRPVAGVTSDQSPVAGEGETGL